MKVEGTAETSSSAATEPEVQESKPQSKRIRLLWYVAAVATGAVALVLLYILSQENYLLFHGSVEVFSIVITFAIFAIAWNSRRIMNNSYLLFIGIAFLFVGVLDLVHTLAYNGMGVFPDVGTNLATQLWLATRYVLSFSMLAALLFIKRKVNPAVIFAVYGAVTALLFTSIFYWQNFPVAFDNGLGHLTTFKIASEYAISAVFLVAIALIWNNRREFSTNVVKFIIVGLALSVIAELAFTLYTDAYGISNMAGHLLDLVAFYFIYKALIETGLNKPYDLLFRNLKQSEVNAKEHAAELEEVNSRLVQEIDSRRKAEEALRESEVKFRTVADFAHDWEYWIAPDGKLLYVSPSCEKVTGYSAEEFMRDPELLLKIVHPEDKGLVLSHVDHVDSGELREFDFRIITRDRETCWISHVCRAVFDGEKWLGRRVSNRATTKRRQAEDALRESEQRFATTLASIGDAVISTDLSGKVHFMNAVAETLTGWTLNDAKDRPIRKVFHIINEQTRLGVEDPVAQVLESGVIVGLANHTVLVRKDGSEVPIDDSGAPIRDKDGNITGVVLVFRDITERKRFEQALERASREWERTFDSVPDLITVLDPNYRILRANQAMAQQLGTTPEQCIGQLCYNCVHGTNAPPEYCPHSKTLQDGKQHIAEIFEPNLEGHFLVSTTPLRDELGQMMGSVHVARNITERKQMLDKLEDYSRHLESLVEERTNQLRDAERLAAIGATAGMVGHDIRNPLQAIASDLYLEKLDVASLPDGECKKSLEESISTIETNLFYIEKIVADLQDFAKPLKPKQEKVSLQRTVEDALTIVEIPENVHVELTAKRGYPRLTADATMMKRMLTNLVQNAVQAMPKGGTLTIGVSRKKGQVAVTVQDTGEGIPEAVKDKMFTPLVTTKSKGQGFGLAVVKRLVEVQGGTIRFETERGKGTKFTVEFPA